MRPTRVCIYGGTDLGSTELGGAAEAFVEALAYRMLGSMPAVIVTGGFLHPPGESDTISTDAAALRGARRLAAERGAPLTECFEAWIPDPALDKRPDIGGRAERMGEADGITIRVMTGRTPLGRRLAMVAGVDLLVTLSGFRHTEIVFEQALELGTPVLPIPDAGGDSREMLEKHRARIAASFAPGALEACLATVSKTIRTNPDAAADAVIELLKTAKFGKCLVLLPYDDAHNHLYDTVIKPAVEARMLPVRLDRLATSGSIYTSFEDSVRTASAIVADITRVNENVMYEIGYAQGRGMTPLLYTRSEVRVESLPVYLRTVNLKVAKEPADVAKVIEEYLESVKSARGNRSGGA